LKYSSPRERVRAVYERGADRYDRLMGLTERLVGPVRALAGAALTGCDQILEIGVGSGLSLPHYADASALLGVDLSLAMLQLARARATRLGIRPRFAQMDAENLALGAARFDGVAFNLALCTIPNPDRALAEAVRVARPGATIVLLEHVRSHLQPLALLQDILTPLTIRADADHLNRRTMDRARAAGIELIEVRTWLAGCLALGVGRIPPA